MTQTAADVLIDRAHSLGLLDERQLREIRGSLVSVAASQDDFVQAVLRSGSMTNYQLDRLLKGEKEGFFYGDYKVLYLVGAGSFARVFRAVHRESGEVVALKVLRRSLSSDQAQYSHFVREGQIGCGLRHPNIVGIKEVYSKGAMHFLVMEFVEGRNLREHMKVRKQLEVAEALPLMCDVARGLAYAFERGVTHRDLRLSNVLVSSRNQGKLVDFGLAGIEDAQDDARGELRNKRSIDYGALERATGVRKDDPRSDIYFLGCMYYQILTGQSPLGESTNQMKLMVRSRFEEIRPVQEVSPKLPNTLVQVINKAMALDPNRRYQHPAAVLSDLELSVRRLQDNPEQEHAPLETAQALPEAAPTKPQLPVIMVVESNPDMQEALRNGLKAAGYRVILTGDPEWAVNRVQQELPPPDVIVIDAETLGAPAVNAFNRLGTESQSSGVPALLLLSMAQRAWRSKVAKAVHRRVMLTPVTMKQLRETIKELLPDRPAP